MRKIESSARGALVSLSRENDCFGIGELAVAGDHDDSAGQLAAVDFAAEGLFDPFQPFG
jgi:hypothetical protein